ncbi:MAG: hypothetical protein P8181_13955 [bacterium]
MPGGQIDSLRFQISNPVTAGSYIIEGDLWVSDVSQQIHINTDLGGTGRLTVQNPGVLTITSIEPNLNRSTVTKGQTGWSIDMTVQNTGQASIQLETQPESTFLVFDLGSGWSTAIQPPGTVVLGENQSTILTFNVNQTGDVADTVTIDGTVRGKESNNGSPRIDSTNGLPEAGQVEVQDPAVLLITGITKRPVGPVTAGQTTPWFIDVTVRNDGGAELELSKIAGETFVMFPNSDPPADPVTGPTGDVTLTGGSTRVLTFTVSETPTFADPLNELKQFVVQISGRELNRDFRMSDLEPSSVLVQRKPKPVYVSRSPAAKKAGETVEFHVIVSEVADAATVELDPAQTRLSVGTTSLRPVLDETGGTSITRGIDTDLTFNAITKVSPAILLSSSSAPPSYLTFNAITIPSDFANDTYPITVRLRGTENGNPFDTSYVEVDDFTVRPPTSVNIVRMRSELDQVTESMTRRWGVWMVVENTGSAPVIVQDTSRLNMVISGKDVTTEYTVNFTPVFDASHTSELAVGAQDSLVFYIDETGTTTGEMTINGIFDGKDKESGADIEDDTFEGEGILVDVQGQGRLEIVRINTQPTVTRGQTADWLATVVVENTGEADVEVTFDRPTTPTIRMPGSTTVWDPALPSGFPGGRDNVLSQGEIDSLIFTATTTGDESGTFVIHSGVSGSELNSNDDRSFDTETNGSGSGQIVVQNPGQVVIRSTTIAAPNEPNVNIDQIFGVRVEVANEGEADLEDIALEISSTGGSGPRRTVMLVRKRLPST